MRISNSRSRAIFRVFGRRYRKRSFIAFRGERAVFADHGAPNVVPSVIDLPWAVGEFATDTAFLTMNQMRMALLLAAAHGRPVGYTRAESATGRHRRGSFRLACDRAGTRGQDSPGGRADSQSGRCVCRHMGCWDGAGKGKFERVGLIQRGETRCLYPGTRERTGNRPRTRPFACEKVVWRNESGLALI